MNINVNSTPTTASTAEVVMIDGNAGSKYPDAIAGIGCASTLEDPCRRTTCNIVFFTETKAGSAISWTLDADGSTATNPSLSLDSFSFPHAVAHEWGHVLGLSDNLESKVGSPTIMQEFVSAPTQYTAIPTVDKDAVKWLYGVP